MKTVTIIGFGRFGKTLYRLIKDDFTVTIYNRSPVTEIASRAANTKIANSLREAYESDVIFFAVPIESFERVVREHKKYFNHRHLLIDVLSVKMHAENVFTKYLKGTKTRAILTHPMFGPDSSKNGFDGLPLIITNHSATPEEYDFWKTYFAGKKLRVIEISAREHDKLAAGSQGLTHFIGRLLSAYGFSETPIDSLGTKKLLEVKGQTCNDTWQLFTGLQHYNPYTKRMRIRLGEIYDRLYNKLLPARAHKGYIAYGIQGGIGSFNEEAIFSFLKKNKVGKYKIKYLYTSKRVMHALHASEIDVGQMAIHNSVGGIVDESIQAMARYKFRIVHQFAIIIAHALMIRNDAKLADIDTIMSHPQVFAQCKSTLAQKYADLKLTSGNGDLIDHAKVAKYLRERKLPKNIATMGSKILAKLYGLTVVEDNLQDSKENFTSFVHVSRI